MKASYRILNIAIFHIAASTSKRLVVPRGSKHFIKFSCINSSAIRFFSINLNAITHTDTIDFIKLEKSLDTKSIDVEISIDDNTDEKITFIEYIDEISGHMSMVLNNDVIYGLLSSFTNNPNIFPIDAFGINHACIYLACTTDMMIAMLQQMCDYVNKSITISIDSNPFDAHMVLSKYNLVVDAWNGIVNNHCLICCDDDATVYKFSISSPRFLNYLDVLNISMYK